MALFGSKDKKKSSQVVRPIVVRTQNVAKEIKNIAHNNGISTDKLDFNILETQTFSRMNDGTKETEWETIDSKELYEIDDETALLNPNFQIKQTYEIEIYSISTETLKICPKLKFAVGANASKCKVYLSITKGSEIEYYKGLEEDLEILIDKKKIRAGILINIFDEMVEDVVSKISAKARIEGKVVYEQAETILVAEGFEPTKTRDDSLVLHYEKKSELDEHEKIDYSSRGFIQSVEKDEILIEYIKPKPGVSGRNCRGKFMQPSDPVVKNMVTFNVDGTISVKEDSDSIKYIANENGYIAFEDNTYLIKTEMEISEISFRTTGSINSGIDSDVNLNVSEADTAKDAVGSGMSVEVTEIDIEGNVGSNANVLAQKATVGGQTHKTSTVKADELNINVHKGKAIGKNIHITRLEHGTVVGDNVDVTQAVGGNIRGREIVIELCASHVKATASKLIEIKKLHGSENIFTINPLLNEGAKEGLSDNQEVIDTLNTTIKELKAEVKKYIILIKEGMPAFLEIKKRLMHYKKSGVKLPASFVKKYKEFTQMQDRLKEVRSELKVKQELFNSQTRKTASFQDNILDTRIINHDRWVGYNEIRYKLVDPPVELVYKPPEGSKDKIFGLVAIDEGQYEIKAMKE